MGTALWIAIVAGIASCYAAACALALRSFNRAVLAERLEADGGANRLSLFVDHADELELITGLIRAAIHLVTALVVLHGAEASFPQWHPIAHYAVAIAAAMTIIAIFGVAIPAFIARYAAEWLLALWASYWALRLALLMFQPVARVLGGLDWVIRRLANVDPLDPGENPASREVLSVMKEHEIAGGVDTAQKQMIEAVFDLPTTTAGQIMTPRTEIQAIPVVSNLDQVKAAILRDGHSRIPVYDATIDNIVGILYAKDLLPMLANPAANPGAGAGPGASPGEKPFDLRKVIRDALIVPESKSVRELLQEFKTRKVHIAIVLDEYGGTAGLLTIEDIIEELVGEIHDEYESSPEAPSIKRINDRCLEADGRAQVGALNSELGLGIPEDGDFDTLGGFVFSTLGHIPTTGETFQLENARFTVIDAARTKVKRVRIELIETQPTAPIVDQAAS